MFKIYKITSDPTVDFAAEELKKYLRMMMPREGEIKIEYNPDAKDGFRLGIMQDFGLDVSEARNVRLDDIIHIDTDEQSGIIAGSNVRSVLLAVYKYLKLNDCRFLFPGIDGESIPVKKVEAQKYHKMADHRYRGQCNEGATSQQHYLDAIDFMPKIGMNCYMLEFDIPHVYYQRWYEHNFNHRYPNEKATEDQILQWKRECEVEIKKRGLLFHDMGHGWTVLPFGMDTHGWGKVDDVPEEILEKARPFLAQINGVRELFTGNPMNTNVCMSNPKARKIMVDYIVDYAERQNNVDFLHIWLSDNRNNHCECEECVKKDTADWYVILLNEIDAELTARNLDTHLVFISYYDTTWAPVKERLINQDRFTMLFAPHTRTYIENFGMKADHSRKFPYERNHLKFPVGMAECLAYYEDWRKGFQGDCFVYEYHFWMLQAYDPSYQFLAKCLYKDIQGLKSNQLDGIIEDSTPRNFMPSGFAQTLIGEVLFDKSIKYEDLETDYMSHAFGENYKKVLDFLNGISDERMTNHLFEIHSRRRLKLGNSFDDPYVLEKAKQWKKAAEDFLPVVKENEWSPIHSQTVLWQNMYFFLKVLNLDADILIAKYQGRFEEAYEIATKGIEELGKEEYRCQTFFDLYLWAYSLRHIFNNGAEFTIVP